MAIGLFVTTNLACSASRNPRWTTGTTSMNGKKNRLRPGGFEIRRKKRFDI